MKNSRIIRKKSELRAFAKELADKIFGSSFSVILLHGDLAAGKTTLVQYLGEFLGVTEHIQSPTYAILRSYNTKNSTLHHLDLYRVMDLETLEAYGVLDMLQRREGIFCIEWPEILNPILGQMSVHPITISIRMEGESRCIEVQS